MRRQRGISISGFLMTSAIVIFIGMTIMRIVPVYAEYYTVVQSIKSLKKMPPNDLSEDSEVNAQILKSSLLKRLAINNIDQNNFEQIALSVQDGSTYNVSVKYKVIKPLIANISLLFDFNISQEVKIATH